jgi:ferredoxin
VELEVAKVEPESDIISSFYLRRAGGGPLHRWFSPREDGTLLELAEEVGLAPAFGCRSGICGTCKTRMLGGEVEYLDQPLADLGKGNILLCCSVPRKTAGESQNGEGGVLDL